MSGLAYYPIHLDVSGKTCLVAGGGAVAARKVQTLLECGASVLVVSPWLCPALESLAGQNAILVRRRGYKKSDLKNVFLVIGATDDEAANAQISADARERNMLVNIVDRPAECSFIVPSVLRRKDLVITVSTGGKSPAFAKHLRKELEGRFGPEYGDFLELMGAIRARLLAQAHAPEEHKGLFERLIAGGLLEHIQNKDLEKADALLYAVLGTGFTVRDLMPEWICGP